MRLKQVVTAVAGFIFMTGAMAGSNDSVRVLKSIQKPVDEILEIHAEYDGLPKNRLFKRDRKAADDELLKLHTAVLEALQISGLSALSDDYSTLQSRIKKMNSRIVDYKEQMLVAPDDDNLLGFKTTKRDLEKKISNAQEYIQDVQAEQEKLIQQIQQLFKENDLMVDATQAKLFLSLSEMEGDGYLDLCSLFINVKMLSGQLAERIRAGEANPDVLKRYYGIYVVLNDAMLLGYENALDTIESVYLVRVRELRERMIQTRRETEKLLKLDGLSESQKILLEGNLKAQAHFVQVCDKVRRYMQSSHDRLGLELTRLQTDCEVARNTYKTAWVGAELLNTFEQFENSFSELQNLTIDPVIPLNDPAIMKQFDDLTERLQMD